MKPRDIRQYLFDIAQACRLLEEFTDGATFADYQTNSMLRAAVERQFEIIGEALQQSIRVDPALVTRISDTPRIISFRNRLIHGYATVLDQVVWGVLEKNVPTLKSEVAALLDELGPLP